MDMSVQPFTKLIVLCVASLFIANACRTLDDPGTVTEPPLADTLRAVFADMTTAITGGRADDFFKLMHPDDTAALRAICHQYGYSSLKAYLEGQMHGWPKVDTLSFADLVTTGPYARLALWGPGTSLGRDRSFIRYTFLLFKQHRHQWRLSAMSTLEKERSDPYGYQITYHETELPSKLRFPRAW
jgi:hypothetical protein